MSATIGFLAVLGTATADKGGTDRTRYADRRRLSYVTHHTRRIATAIIKNDAYAINGKARHLKTVLQACIRLPTASAIDGHPSMSAPTHAGGAAF